MEGPDATTHTPTSHCVLTMWPLHCHMPIVRHVHNCFDEEGDVPLFQREFEFLVAVDAVKVTLVDPLAHSLHGHEEKFRARRVNLR